MVEKAFFFWQFVDSPKNDLQIRRYAWTQTILANMGAKIGATHQFGGFTIW
jgi:hypothetical protein